MRRIPLHRLKHFAKHERGAAAVEFALILPFLLLLFMGSIEASSLITVDRRINVISGTVGDLVARTDGTLSSSQMTDYFQAAQGIIIPYTTTNLQQVVSLIHIKSDGTTEVTWSCAYNGGTARTKNTPYASLPPKMKALADGAADYVVASETSYSYRPVLGMVFQDAIDLYNESFYLPRYEAAIGEPTGC